MMALRPAETTCATRPSHEPSTASESPYLTTSEAAVYLRYRSGSAIRTLKMKGHLRPAGRRGSVDLYLRDDLDRFVAGPASGTIHAGRSEAPRKDHAQHDLDA